MNAENVLKSCVGWFITVVSGVLGAALIYDERILEGLPFVIGAVLMCPLVLGIVKKITDGKGNLAEALIGILSIVFGVMLLTGDVNGNSLGVSGNSLSDNLGATDWANVSSASVNYAPDTFVSGNAVDSYDGYVASDTAINNNTTPPVVTTPESVVATGTVEENQNADFGKFQVHFIDVGQGDAVLVSCNNHNMLIDAGDNSKGTTVQLYLNKQGVQNLDAVIWSHPDADHIGGADVITTKYDIGAIYMPGVNSDTNTYNDLLYSIEYRNYAITVPVPGDSFYLGDAKVTFVGPWQEYQSDNNNSLCCRIDYGDTSFLFTGDAEEEAERAMISHGANLDVDVLKAGHHGSRTSTTMDFLAATTPESVVISCGNNNSYGHPHSETLNNLRSLGINVYRTDEQGAIIATSDGNTISWNMSPSVSWQAGEPTGGSQNTETSQNTGTSQAAGTTQSDGGAQSTANTQNVDDTSTTGNGNYIGNINSRLFHLPTCYTLPKEQNRVYFNTRDEAVNQGYIPCKNCEP